MILPCEPPASCGRRVRQSARQRRPHISINADSACRALYNSHVLNPRSANEVLLLAVCPELSENSRREFESKSAPTKLGPSDRNSNSTLEMHVSFPKTCGRSRVQTWNRYAYVGNNPLSNVDPFGLDCKAAGGHQRAATVRGGGGCSGGGGDGGGVSIDGGSAIPIGLFGDGGSFGSGLGGGESAVQCPGNVCSGFAIDKNGNPVWVQFIATAGGVNGYYRPQDLTNGIYEYDGQLYNSANYQALLKQLYAPQISSQCSTVGGNLSAAAPGTAQLPGRAVPLLTRRGHRPDGGGPVHRVPVRRGHLRDTHRPAGGQRHVLPGSPAAAQSVLRVCAAQGLMEGH